MKSDIQSEGSGPERNSADYRIKKAQVSTCWLYFVPTEALSTMSCYLVFGKCQFSHMREISQSFLMEVWA